MHTGQTRPGLVLKSIQNITTILLSGEIRGWSGTWAGAWYLQYRLELWDHGLEQGLDLGFRLVISKKNWNLGFCWDSPLVWYLGLCWSRDWILGSKLGISDRSNLLSSCFLGWIGTWFVAGTFHWSAVWGIKGVNGWIGLGQPGFCGVSLLDWILGWHWDLQMSWSLDFNLTYLFDWNLLGLGILLVFLDGLGRYLDCWTDSNWDWSLGCGLAY